MSLILEGIDLPKKKEVCYFLQITPKMVERPIKNTYKDYNKRGERRHVYQ